MDEWHGSALEPLPGGYSGETFVCGDGDQRVVVRIYARDPARAAVDASLLRLVRGLVPVPAVLELRLATESKPALLVTEYVAGERLDLVLGAPESEIDHAVLGRSLAGVLDALGGIPFLRTGMFADSDLSLAAAPLPGDLREWAEALRPRGRLATWPAGDWDALLSLADLGQDLLDDHQGVEPRAVLAHSDFNPKNILVDPGTSQVVAVLDWEFAHAGSPYTDIGNLCRFERDHRLTEPLLSALARPAAGDPARHLRLGRAVDLWALIELAARPRPSPVQQLATELLLGQARSCDLEAWPWDAQRIDPSPLAGL